MGAQLARRLPLVSYRAHELNWVLGWAGGLPWLPGAEFSLFASVLQAASFHEMNFG